MLSEKEINLVLGKDLNVREKKEELSFRDWQTVKGIICSKKLKSGWIFTMGMPDSR
jgi:hypothetical protein